MKNPVMTKERLTKEQLKEELAGMRQSMCQLNECRKEFESAQDRYKKLLDATPDSMIFVSKDYEIISVNSQAEELFGYTQEEMVCHRLDLLIPNRYHRVHRGFVEGFFSNPRRRPMGAGLKIYARKKDGTEFRANISLSPLRLNEDLVTVAAIRDITGQVMEQESIERNYYLQQAVDSILKISLEEAPLKDKMARALEFIVSFPYLSLERNGAVYLVSGNSNTRELAVEAETGMDEEHRVSCRRVPMGNCLCGKSALECEVLFMDCTDGHDLRFNKFPHGHYCVPIVAAGENPEPLGLLNVYVREGHRRDEAEEAFLRSVADIFAGMIVRKGSKWKNTSSRPTLPRRKSWRRWAGLPPMCLMRSETR